ncbi:hypothetical protein [Methanoregula sp.]|uniref:hypothetical protein n=1 Tax=Methanoregula sp. TaxID=2052170 RepID=UPI002BEF10F3|nr:hypothetical protein [Methanoregula sp.]HVP96498.1 hypothetical protein [Methanoregula sp.]
MIGMDSYLDAYVDRRMKNIVEEWDLSTQADLGTFSSRLAALEQEIPRIQAFEKTTSEKLAELENRAARLKGRV